ncbi:Acetylornithine deacetylase/Succinyl-diaminopimelate desuccinylase [Sphingobium faniae]|nr:Acetylornithine deacetylase/Succinyl-diaminopimelate desuccinylase [Sphingobium faniae]
MKAGRGTALALALVLTAGQGALAAPLRPDQTAFREIYRELVETDSSAPTGSCTLAAERMLARLKNAGFGAAQAEVFVPEGRPRDGGLIARIEGSDPDAGAMLLVDHIDVVAARREDWPRDPFQLAEEDGYFIGRGVIDDKALSAIWIDSLIRMKKEGFRPRRTIKVALTCGEESGDAVNGVQWLLRHRRDAVEAGFALNEGGYGMTDAAGKPIALYLAVGEKHSQTFSIEARNSGGHSSRPRPDNAIYDLADALTAIRGHSFPVRLNPTNRGYFTRMAPIIGGDMGQAMAAVGKGEADPQAMAKVTGDVTYNAMLRTTCVATQVEAGHAINALPQRARATIQCRLFPGEKPEDVEMQLRAAIGNPAISLSRAEGEDRIVAVPPPLDPAIMGPAEDIARKQFPGIPVIPNLLTAGTDGRYLSAAGIATYGVPGIFLDPDGNGAHGVNERVRVKSVYEGRDYLYALIKRYAGSR